MFIQYNHDLIQRHILKLVLEQLETIQKKGELFLETIYTIQSYFHITSPLSYLMNKIY